MYSRVLILVFMVNPIFSMKKDIHMSDCMQKEVQILICNKNPETPRAKKRRWLVIDKQKKADCYIKKVEFFALKIKRALNRFDEIIMKHDYSIEHYDSAIYEYHLISEVHEKLQKFYMQNYLSQDKNKFIDEYLLDYIENQWGTYMKGIQYYAYYSEYYIQENKKNTTKDPLT